MSGTFFFILFNYGKGLFIHQIKQFSRNFAKNRDNISEQEAAIEEVKDRQTQNPTNPNQPFANRIRQRTIDFLNLEDENKEENLKFYSAASSSENKTMLDRDFGIDAFLELKQEEKKFIIVSIDLTLKQFKQNPKADIVFSLPDDFPAHVWFDEKGKRIGLSGREEETFQKYTEDLARQIVEKIEKKLKK